MWLHCVVNADALFSISVGPVCGFVSWEGRILDMKKNGSIKPTREKALHKKKIFPRNIST